jgi:NitT/TauT family transport system substrate-binding protein
VPGLATLWDKTVGTANEVRALCAVQSMPFYLVTNNASVRSIHDFTEKDKIALPAVKVSSQAICLQMAAAKAWGDDHYARLDPITITRPHPDAATAVISKSSEINAHYAAAPFYHYELAVPGIRSVLRSYDTFGGPKTNGVLIMSKRFGDANARSCAAVYAALEEANTFINQHPGDAARVYIAMANEKRSTLDEMSRMIADPENVWTTVPDKSMAFLAFMHKAGTVKKLPGSWKDLYMPAAHALAGS